MTRARIAAAVVEMDDGRLALLVEMEPDPGLGPLVVGPGGDAAAPAGPDARGEQRVRREEGGSVAVGRYGGNWIPDHVAKMSRAQLESYLIGGAWHSAEPSRQLTSRGLLQQRPRRSGIT